MAPGCHVDKAPGRLCEAPEGRDRTPECVGVTALASQGQLSDVQSGPARDPWRRLRAPWRGWPGPAQVASLTPRAPEPLPSPTASPVGRGDGKEQVREATGPGAQAVLTVP